MLFKATIIFMKITSLEDKSEKEIYKDLISKASYNCSYDKDNNSIDLTIKNESMSEIEYTKFLNQFVFPNTPELLRDNQIFIGDSYNEPLKIELTPICSPEDAQSYVDKVNEDQTLVFNDTYSKADKSISLASDFETVHININQKFAEFNNPKDNVNEKTIETKVNDKLYSEKTHSVAYGLDNLDRKETRSETKIYDMNSPDRKLRERSETKITKDAGTKDISRMIEYGDKYRAVFKREGPNMQKEIQSDDKTFTLSSVFNPKNKHNDFFVSYEDQSNNIKEEAFLGNNTPNLVFVDRFEKELYQKGVFLDMNKEIKNIEDLNYSSCLDLNKMIEREKESEPER